MLSSCCNGFELLAMPTRAPRAGFVGALKELERLLRHVALAALFVRQHEAMARFRPVRFVRPHGRPRVASRLGVMQREERGSRIHDVAGPESDLAHLVRKGFALDPAARRWIG